MPRLPSQLTYNDLNGAEATEILVDWFRQLLSQQPLLQPHLTLPMAKITLDIGVAIDMYVGGTVPVASEPDRVNIAGAVTLTNDTADSGSLPHASMSRASNQPTVREVDYEHSERKLSTVINAAPQPGGSPPDQIRQQHDLPVPRPGYGPRDIGAHVFLADVPVEQSHPRTGIVAEGYTFASEPSALDPLSLSQTIPISDTGTIEIDMSGKGIHHDSGIIVKESDHRASVKEAGDQRGTKYGSVNGVYDAGPAGLMRKGGAGLGGDGRSRISFGNSYRG